MSAGSWDDVYVRDTAPWEIGRPQPGIVRVGDVGDIAGRVLDSGCGSGEHALMAATMGLEATGVDLAQTAIERARAKARARGLIAEFIVGNVLDLPGVERLHPPYQTVIDTGCFHSLANADRPVYASSLAAVTEPGGLLHLLCFSELTPGTHGPRRVTEAEIRQAFARDWIVDRVEPDVFMVNNHWEGPEPSAWLARIVRR